MKYLLLILCLLPLHAEDLSRFPEIDLRQRAVGGNMEACTELAFRYCDGHVVPFDPAFVFESFKKASAAGLARAHAGLGLCYSKGLGVDRDAKEALRLYQMAADAKDPRSLFSLGSAYCDGWGLPRDLQKGIELYQESARLGCDLGAAGLAWLSVQGEGVSKDVDGGLGELVRLSEANNSARAAFLLGLYYSGEMAFNKEPNPGLAWKYMTIAAERDNAVAMFKLAEWGKLPVPGKKPDKAFNLASRQESRAWYSKAAQRNHPEAMEHQAMDMMRNTNVREAGVDWYDYLERAAQAGDLHATLELGSVNYHAPGYNFRDLDWSKSAAYFQQYLDGMEERLPGQRSNTTHYCIHLLCRIYYEGGLGSNRDFNKCLAVAKPELGICELATAYSGLTLLHPDSPVGGTREHYVRGYACMLSARKMGYLISDKGIFQLRSRHNMTRQEVERAAQLSDGGFPNSTTPLLP